MGPEIPELQTWQVEQLVGEKPKVSPQGRLQLGDHKAIGTEEAHGKKGER